MKYDVSKEIIAIFDPDFYSQVYLQKQLSLKEALAHYINEGAAKGWFPNQLFHSHFYLAQTGPLSTDSPLHHYAAVGASRGLSPNPLFDPVWYAKTYHPENNGLSPFAHFCLSQKTDTPTNPNEFFDVTWYVKNYGKEINGSMHPLNHYYFYGLTGLYDASPRFSSRRYVKIIEGLREQEFNPLQHYLFFGRREGRPALPIDDGMDENFKSRFHALIKGSDIVHFHHNDRFVNSTIEFVNENFPHLKQCHLVLRNMDVHFTRQPFPQGENVIELDYDLLDPAELIGKKLIFHSLVTQKNIDLLYENPELLKSAYWMVWGGDLYNIKNDERGKFVRDNIYGIGSFSDNPLIRERYGIKHKFFETNLCINPVTKALFALKQKTRVKEKGAPVIIQINHSANKSTLEMLDALARHAEDNIRVKTVVCYGDGATVPLIRAKGTEIFGKKFSMLEKQLSPEDYLEYIAENDILILNQNRQQGSANACMALSLGQKVFIRSEITTSDWLKDLGAVIYDSKKVPQMALSEIINYPQEIQQNNIRVVDEKIYGTAARVEEFRPVLEDTGYLANMQGGTACGA